MRLAEIRDLAYRFVPATAADGRLYRYNHRSWWPAHEIGHFLIATADECRRFMFGIEDSPITGSKRYGYIIAREIGAMSISQRLLRRSGHVAIANEEVEYTDEDTLACATEPWCKRAVKALLRKNSLVRLPRTRTGLEHLLTRKAREVKTSYFASRRAAEAHETFRGRDAA